MRRKRGKRPEATKQQLVTVMKLKKIAREQEKRRRAEVDWSEGNTR